ncbi:hypothetical protein [Noviherbaspirillum aerium]|uniref:hypothetical protein n=1 Tax=Noviherbaspirillum aerium TaxID=2588497 RepID=UPI00124CF73A|nr:hypothetical protein [Noviherbaspirillum aerium]
MRLRDLKKWYSLKDAAVRLSPTLSETVEVGDLLQLIVERKLQPSLILQGENAREVHWHRDEYSKGDQSRAAKLAQEFVPQPDDAETIIGISYWKPISDDVVGLDGLYGLNMDEGHARDHILSLVTGRGGDRDWSQGSIVFDEYGRNWQLLERRNNSGRYAQYPDGTVVDIVTPRSITYHPRVHRPGLDEIVVSSSDLELFERSLLVPTENDSEKAIQSTKPAVIARFAPVAEDWQELMPSGEQLDNRRVMESRSISDQSCKDVADLGSIPGAIPRVANRKLAIKAAWTIESITKRVASTKDVMQLLQTWADSGAEPEVLIKSDRPKKAVIWRTGKGKQKLFDVFACEKALEAWTKSRP